MISSIGFYIQGPVGAWNEYVFFHFQMNQSQLVSALCLNIFASLQLELRTQSEKKANFEAAERSIVAAMAHLVFSDQVVHLEWSYGGVADAIAGPSRTLQGRFCL